MTKISDTLVGIWSFLLFTLQKKVSVPPKICCFKSFHITLLWWRGVRVPMNLGTVFSDIWWSCPEEALGPYLEPYFGLSLDLCAWHGLSIMNTMFKQNDAYKCTWYHSTLGQKTVINFVIVPSDLRPQCWTQVKEGWGRVARRVKLSTDGSSRKLSSTSEGETGPFKLCMDRIRHWWAQLRRWSDNWRNTLRNSCNEEAEL